MTQSVGYLEPIRQLDLVMPCLKLIPTDCLIISEVQEILCNMHPKTCYESIKTVTLLFYGSLSLAPRDMVGTKKFASSVQKTFIK